MAIPKAVSTNFNTLLRAIKAGQVVLLECQDRNTGENIYTICAVNEVDGEVEMAPFAKMFNGNPYEELAPPAPEGGFHV